MSSSQRSAAGVAASQGLYRRLEADRQRLLDSGIYLGEPGHSFLPDATWKRIGRGYQLVTNDSIEAANAASKTTDLVTTDDDTESGNVDPQTDPNSLFEQAVFSIVVQISYNNCWLTPCGHWKGPNKVVKKFEDLKLTFEGERPGHEVFSQDFATAISNIRQLINTQISAIQCPANTELQGILSNSRTTNAVDVLKFRHVVFEVSLHI